MLKRGNRSRIKTGSSISKEKINILPNSRSRGEHHNRRVILRRFYPINVESLTHDPTQLHQIASLKPAELLGSGPWHARHQELKLPLRSRSGGWRRDGEKGGPDGAGGAELQVLAGARVGGCQAGGVGDIDADMEEGLSSWGDPRDWGLGPGDRVGEGGARGGETAAEDRGKAAEGRHERKAGAFGAWGK